jgi:hypothetical protein
MSGGTTQMEHDLATCPMCRDRITIGWDALGDQCPNALESALEHQGDAGALAESRPLTARERITALEGLVAALEGLVRRAVPAIRIAGGSKAPDWLADAEALLTPNQEDRDQ